jgi:hypothetical protein
MMRTADRTLALLYFENKTAATRVHGLNAGASYQWTWFDPRSGTWRESTRMQADRDGTVLVPAFPSVDATVAQEDWAAKLSQVK